MTLLTKAPRLFYLLTTLSLTSLDCWWWWASSDYPADSPTPPQTILGYRRVIRQLRIRTVRSSSFLERQRYCISLLQFFFYFSDKHFILNRENNQHKCGHYQHILRFVQQYTRVGAQVCSLNGGGLPFPQPCIPRHRRLSSTTPSSCRCHRKGK